MSIENLSFSVFYTQIWVKSKDLTPVRFEPSNFGCLVTRIFIGLFKPYTVTAMLLFQLETLTTMAHMTPKIGIRVFPLKGSFTLWRQRQWKILSHCHCIVSTFTCCHETHFSIAVAITIGCRNHSMMMLSPCEPSFDRTQPMLDNKFPLSLQPQCERTFKLVDELIKFNDFPLETCRVINIMYVWSR